MKQSNTYVCLQVSCKVFIKSNGNDSIKRSTLSKPEKKKLLLSALQPPALGQRSLAHYFQSRSV